MLPWVAACAVAAPLLWGGFPNGHDWTFELVRVSEYRSALADGQLPPAWAPNLYGGYGSPIFLFYAPAYAALSTLLSFVTGSIERGATAALVLLVVFAVLATRRLVAALPGSAGPRAERLAVYLYLLHPYLLCDLYLRNANAEFAALCLAPLALAGIFTAQARPSRAPLLLAAAFAAVIVSHNLTAVVVAAMLALAALLGLRRGAGPRTWIAPAGGVLLGLALAAFFWVPALVLKPRMRTGELTGGEFDFHLYFADPFEIFGYGEFFSAGMLTPIVLALGLHAAWRAARSRSGRARILIGALTGAALLIYLVTSASAALWERLPLLPLFQFPWRMLGPLALLAALVGALTFSELASGWSRRTSRGVEATVFVLCLLNALPQLLDYRPLAPRVREALAVQLTGEAIRSEGYKATVGDEYLPLEANATTWQTRRPLVGPLVGSDPPLLRAEVEVDEGTSSSLRVEARRASHLELARWAFPGWQYQVDGRPEPWRAGPFGGIEAELPAGERRVELRYRSPRVRTLSLALSLVAVLAWLALLWRDRRGAET
jgi:hypothetical protein